MVKELGRFPNTNVSDRDQVCVSRYLRHCGERTREKLVRGDREFTGGQWREGCYFTGPGRETENPEKRGYQVLLLHLAGYLLQ